MKKGMKIISSILLLTFVFTSAFSVFAATDKAKISAINSDIAAIETELSMQGSTVETELRDLISTFKYEQTVCDPEDIVGLQDLIDTTTDLLNSYSNYKNGVIPASVNMSMYDPAIAAVVSYFNLNNYFLASELLLHAKDNTVVDSTFKPYYGDRVNYSPVTQQIRKSVATRGTGEFAPSSVSEFLQDLYYAIHYFEWEKTSTAVHIFDRYDFAPGDWDGLAGIAINTMYNAQQAGAIVPFYTHIYTNK